ncbi:hypothetical protein MKX07_008210 [Trichoderma sp. CBMAI-0711]|uniref:Uncharacterized protein n=1 Tax=Trichoderma parareesei TaxID=858221 RepID=A0A2H2ZUW5_TRIPA|nr:hypothetical protein MKX07_008210 [Trichoderma sp. CBMAI-0711]OTA08492.1 hypothetical protein A9Z42_0001980 [Trichoderma parareesei]
MSDRPGLWESHVRGESSTSQFKLESDGRSSLWGHTAAFSTSGTAQYGPAATANGDNHMPGQSSMSGIDSSTRNSAALSPANGNSDVKGKGRASDIDHDMPLLNSGDLPQWTSSMVPLHSQYPYPSLSASPGYDGAHAHTLNRGGMPTLPAPGLMSPFAAGHHSYHPQPSAPFDPYAPGHHSYHPQPSVPFGPNAPRREFPSFFGPQNPGHDGSTCRCSVCSSGSPAMCFQQQLAKQQASINAVWDDERTRFEACRSRVEYLVRQEGRIILDHYRQGWDEERDRLQSEITALRNTIKGFEDGHLQLCEDHRKLWVENLKLHDDVSRLQEDNSRLRQTLSNSSDAPLQAQGAVEGATVHHSNAQSMSTNPPELAASSQGGRPSGRSPRNNPWSAWVDSLPRSTSMVDSICPVQAPTRATSRSPPPPPAGISASQGPELSELPSERHALMSPQPEYGSNISSPVLSLYQRSPVPLGPASSNSARLDSPVPFCPASPNLVRSESVTSYHPASPVPFRLDSPMPFCPASPTLARPASPVPKRSPKRPLSVIDINEVDAGLEGISLRANTVRRTTFAAEGTSEGAPPSKRQRSLSQEYCIVNNLLDDDDEEAEEEYDDERDKEEVRRLKMHAGHTPPPQSPPARHSQGSPTPLAPSSPPERKPVIVGDMAMAESLRSASEDSGDVPLDGPLMMLNDPAEDESFLAALNQKLEPISQGVDALPRAVQPSIGLPASLSAEEPEVGVFKLEQPSSLPIKTEDIKLEQHSYPIIKTEVKTEDVKPYIKDEDDDDYSDDAKGAEPDVPIKFKSTRNFGAPFGRM